MDHLQIFTTLACTFLALLAFFMAKHLDWKHHLPLLRILQLLALTLFVYDGYGFVGYYKSLNIAGGPLFPVAVNAKLVAYLTLMLLLCQRALQIRIAAQLLERKTPFRLGHSFIIVGLFVTFYFGIWVLTPTLIPWFGQGATAFRHLLAAIELVTMVWVLRAGRTGKEPHRRRLLISFALFFLLEVLCYAIRWPLHQAAEMSTLTRLVTQVIFPIYSQAILPLWLWLYLRPWLERATSRRLLADLTQILAPYGLTPREKEVLAVLLKGKSNQAIADELFASEHTIKNIITAIYAKLGVKNRKEIFHRIYGGRCLTF